MRTLAHLSDLHFGRLDRGTVQALIATITEAKPDIVVVSGDLTQRAKVREFREARKFLETLPSPQIVVPGNHDVPLYNVLARALKPLRNYKRYISKDLEPFFCDDEIAIIGINKIGGERCVICRARSVSVRGIVPVTQRGRIPITGLGFAAVPKGKRILCRGDQKPWIFCGFSGGLPGGTSAN